MSEKPLVRQARVGRLEGLRALRNVLAREIEKGEGQTAALAKQLRDVLRDIAELERLMPSKSVVDDLANRRRARRDGAASGDKSAGESGN